MISGVSPLRGFCNTDCPEDATEYASSVLQELFQKINDGCLKYNIIQIDDTQDLMVQEIKDIDLPFNGSQTFYAHDMKNNGLDFSNRGSIYPNHILVSNNPGDIQCLNATKGDGYLSPGNSPSPYAYPPSNFPSPSALSFPRQTTTRSDFVKNGS